MKLTTCKTKPHKCKLIKDILINEISDITRRSIRFISGRHIRYIAKHEYHIPDSRWCQEALALSAESSPDFLINHCLRSYALGVAMAHKINKPFDREVLFVGSILHDIGLTQKYDNEKTFEVGGAKIAFDFCMEKAVIQSKANLVHEMVALHNSVGVAHKKDPEVALLHFGAGADVAGLWIKDVHAKTLTEIIEQYPRLDFKQGMVRLIADQIERKPYSYMATLKDVGFLEKIKSAPFDS